LLRTEPVSEETSLEDAVIAMKDGPLLVCGESSAGKPERLVGIVTAFDLL